MVCQPGHTQSDNFMTRPELLCLTSGSVQFSCFIITVTLLVRWLSPEAKRAARSWTALTWLILSFLAGLQTVNVYSRDDLTSVEYHWALMFVGQRLMFLL
jgi:hypothetical protein